ncbi:MAG: S41 family peptidase [Phycisphaeraceae bacterium]|nr:S41 family peptidase [Phycisphaeraceae bacterium]
MAKPRLLFQTSLIGILAVAVLGSTLVVSRQDYSFFDPLVHIKSVISQRYVDQPDEKAMQESAIRGMVESLNDPYTVYVPPADSKNFTKDLTGDYVGIGAQVTTRDRYLTVVTPLEDSPAFKAGILPDDRIVEIDGTTTLDMTTEESVDRLVGEAGTKVNLLIERKGERFNVTIARERIIAHTVKGFSWKPAANGSKEKGAWQFMIDPERRIAFLRLTQFTPTSAEEFAEVLKGLGADKGEVKGLVLDLRNNPGGVLQDAEAIADMFLEGGTIVSTKGRAVREQVSRAVKEGTLPPFPIAIVINGQSASASEVLSGALVDNGRAITIGTRTFGKGLVQSVHTIPNHGQLKVTEQRYYLPSGRSIHRSDDSVEWGVDPAPGFYIPATDAEVREMLQARREHETISSAKVAAASNWADPEWISSTMKDKQLAAALKAVQIKIDSGEWKPTGQPLPEVTAAASQELAKTRAYRARLERELDRVYRRLEGLESAAGEKTPEVDLWGDAVEVAGGQIEVFDKSGKSVGRFKVTAPDLERWLIDAGVTKEEVQKP